MKPLAMTRLAKGATLWRTIRALAALGALLLLSTTPLARAGGGYDLAWWSADGGGEVATGFGSSYRLSGAAGQPDASRWVGGGYSLVGGFWGVGAIAGKGSTIHLPMIPRQR